jgi:hypothetical protein
MNCGLVGALHETGSLMANLSDLICLFMRLCYTHVLKTKPPDIAAKLLDSFCKVSNNFFFSLSPFAPPRHSQLFFLYPPVQISRQANAVLMNKQVQSEIVYNSVWNQICFEAASAMPENRVTYALDFFVYTSRN